MSRRWSPPTTSPSTAHEIAFVDYRLADLDEIVSAVPQGIRIVLIDGGRDGVEQMVDALDGEEGITGIHIISHGSAGSLQLGTSTLDANTMSSTYRQALESINRNLSEDADILIYGCDVAAGTEGRAFVDALADATGADIAASIDATGTERLGGDWVLEHATGAISAPGIVVTGFDHLLLPPHLDLNSADNGSTTIATTNFGTGSYAQGTGAWTGAWVETDFGAGVLTTGDVFAQSGAVAATMRWRCRTRTARPTGSSARST